MRRLGHETGMRAPSIYKHFPDKASVELALIEEGLVDVGDALHAAVRLSGPEGPVRALLTAYRAHALAHPNLYRLATGGPLARDRLTAGLEEWAGEPFFLATGEPALAQAMWSYAHGMVILELDGRYPDGSDLDATWEAGTAAFTGPRSGATGRRSSGPAAGGGR